MGQSHRYNKDAGDDSEPARSDRPASPVAQSLPSFLRGGRELGHLIMQKDWSQTPLGPLHSWPLLLRHSVSLMLNSSHPMFVAWGPEQTFLYNDAYVPVLSEAKHPVVLGQPFAVVWAEIWQICEPLTAKVFKQAESTFVESVRFFMSRGLGRLEETYYSFSYSPLLGEDGSVVGLFNVSTPVTGRVLSERRLQTLGVLSAKSLVEKAPSDVVRSVAATLEQNLSDFPFAALYLRDQGSDVLHRAALIGLQDSEARTLHLAPSEATSDGGSRYPWGQVLAGDEVLVSLGNIGDAPALGLAGQAVGEALLLPLASMQGESVFGVLLCGINPCCPLDDEYSSFLRLAAAQVASAINHARLYAEQRERAEALAALDRAKTLFFNNVSHELRTPLTLILGPLDEALSRLGDGPLRGDLQLMRRNGRRLLRLVNTLLDFSRIEAGRMQARFIRTNLGALTRELASGFESAMEKAGLELRLAIDEGGSEAFVDRDLWEKIVLNLLANAFKYTHHGSVAVELCVLDTVLELSVSDTGIGIPAAEQPRIFERFHRIHGAVGRTHEGTGIGLALVYELVRMHGGEIAVQSREGVGSTFTVRIPRGWQHLPANQVDRQTTDSDVRAGTNLSDLDDMMPWVAGLEAEEAEAQTLALRTEVWDSTVIREPQVLASGQAAARILLAEDSADMRAYIRRLIGSEWQLVTASDGTEALEILQRSPPVDLVLSDVMMPRLDGFGLLRAIRTNPATSALPVILLSARAGEEARVEGLDATADDYLVKPFSSRELKARVHGALRIAKLRQESAAAVAAAMEVFRTAVYQAPIPIMLRERAGKVIAISKAWTDISGYKLEDIPTVEAWIKLAYPPERWTERQGVAKNIDTMEAESWQFESPIITRTRQVRDWVFHIAPLAMDHRPETLIMVATMDITERKRAERDLAETREAAIAASRAKSDFLANMSHEIRTPLGAILGFAELLSEAETVAERGEAIAAIKRNGELLLRLVSDILDLSKIEAGRLNVDVEEVQLADFFHGARQMLAASARDKGLTLDLSLDGELPPVILTDSTRLRQIFVNTVGNAIKFTSQGEVSILVRYDAAAEALRVDVRDSGIGLAKEQQDAIWEAFVQADSSTTRRFGGTGLGLTLSRRLARALGGDLVLSASEPGVGSTFSFWVKAPEPARQDASPRASSKPLLAAEQTSRKPLAGIHILVVDDSPDNRHLGRRLLEKLGAAVDVAASGREGVDLALAGPRHDIVLMDIQMPGGIDGYQAVAELRARGYERPVVALTAQVMKGERERAKRLGFAGFLTKPINREELVALVCEACAKKV